MRAWLMYAVGAWTAACGVVPHTHTTSVSPDASVRAYVRQAFNIEQDDHLYLATGDAPATELLALQPDMDWCRTIVWTPDSRTVGFLVNDQVLALFDVRTREHVAMVDLIGPDGPWNRFEARALTIGNDRRSVSFERYERPVAVRTPKDGQRYEYPVVWPTSDPIVRAGKSLGRRTVAIPRERLKLRIEWPPAAPGALAWVRMVAADGREVLVKVPAARNRVIELPAFDAGPLAAVKVSAHGPRGELEDVPITNEAATVRLSLN